jgi:hypothetical protein
MTERQQRFCIWAGVGFAPIFFTGFWVVAQFIPPPAPSRGAASITRMFAEDRDRIRIGLWITTGASPLLAFYVAAITHQIRRICGPGSPVATAQAIAGCCIILEFIFPLLVWQTAAYRADRSPDLVLMLNDLAWLPFVGIVGTFIAQTVCVAYAVFTDRSDDPLLPRWVAYLSIWAALGVASGSLVVFTQHGPFAWNGILAWWLLVVAFFIWFVAMAWLMLRATRLEGQRPQEVAA